MEISRTKEEIQEIASYIRLELYNMGLPSGPEEIKKWKNMERPMSLEKG